MCEMMGSKKSGEKHPGPNVRMQNDLPKSSGVKPPGAKSGCKCPDPKCTGAKRSRPKRPGAKRPGPITS